MTREIRILIADDHPIVRQGLRYVIERDTQLKIVAEAGDGRTAFETLIALRPEVAILDIDMPCMNGLEVLRAIGQAGLAVAVIVLSVHREEEFFQEALSLGARGYVLKDSVTTDILACIHAVARGENFASPALTAYLFKQARRAEPPPFDIESLTPTERAILRLIAEYKTSKQIADQLHISPHTVRTHRQNICAKLALEGNHGLMRFALEHKTKL
ncbi:MAG TPA: response regulator transcription factor [Blastocatellia bacterium]|nr:response regulator transcription factor [Blastocatellia bacterium]